MNIKNEIMEAYVENKKIFGIVIGVFILGMLIAAVIANDIADFLLPLLKESLGGDSTSINAFSIMYQNEISALTIVAGSAIFGIYPILASFANGFAIGFLAGHLIKSIYTLALFLTLIIPHGIFEIPALLSDCVSGILLFLFIYRVLKDKINGMTLKEAYYNNQKTIKHMIILLVVSIILFMIAALIEGYITPYLGNIVSTQLGGQKLL